MPACTPSGRLGEDEDCFLPTAQPARHAVSPPVHCCWLSPLSWRVLAASGGSLCGLARRWNAARGPLVVGVARAGHSLSVRRSDLFAAANPVRLVRDHRHRPALRSACGHGQRRPGGRSAGAARAGRRTRWPDAAVQDPTSVATYSSDRAGLAVRTDRVQRSLLVRAARRSPPPGTVVLADGRRLMAAGHPLAGIWPGDSDRRRHHRSRDFGELADVVFPSVDVAAAVLDDNLWAGGDNRRGDRPLSNGQRRGRDRRSREPRAGAVPPPRPRHEHDLLLCPARLGRSAAGHSGAGNRVLRLSRRLRGAAVAVLGRDDRQLPADWPAAAVDGKSHGRRRLAGRRLVASRTLASRPMRTARSRLTSEAAQTLELARRAGPDGRQGRLRAVQGCRLGETATRALWDSGVIQGKDGLRRTGPLKWREWTGRVGDGVRA